MTAQEQEVMTKGGATIQEMETQRFRLDPSMSYVPRAVREQDPEFWMPHR